MPSPLFRIIGVILLLLVVFIVFTIARFQWLVHVGWKLAQDVPAFERRKENGSPKILVVGDSTAVGVGTLDGRGSIAGRFAKDFPNAEVRNRGISGLRAPQLAENFPSYNPGEYDLVVIQIGANDIVNGTPIDEFSRSLSKIFDRAREAGMNVVALHCGNVGLAPIFPWPLRQIMRARTLRYREEYKRIAAEKGVAYVDLYHEAADDFFQGKHRFYARDLFHLSDEGYGVWYRELRNAMAAANITL